MLLMQALHTLATPEEKLAALCKKYADLVSVAFRAIHVILTVWCTAKTIVVRGSRSIC